jgi:hypothetical protein
MSEALRVKTEAKYRQLYNDLKNFIVGDFHELFFICACLGYAHNRRKALEGERSDQERFWSDTITPKEWSCYKAIIFRENDYNIKSIQDEREILNIMEEYANGGICILIEQFLKDFVIQENGLIRLDQSLSKELPKHFLYYLYNKIDFKSADRE